MSQNDFSEQELRNNPYQPTELSATELYSDRELLTAMVSTAKWQLIFAVLGFVATGFVSLILVFQLLAFRFASPMVSGTVPVLVGLLLVSFSSIFFCLIPSILLWRAATALRQFEKNATGSFATAMQAQCSFWRYIAVAALLGIFVSFSLLFAAMIGGASFLFGR